MHNIHPIELIITLLLIVSVLAVVAAKIRVALPIFMTIAGLIIGFIPGFPKVELDPDLVFLFFLPPLLYVSSLQTSWRDFKRNMRPITMLAVGLVLATTAGVAIAAKFSIEGISWGAAFILGAIVSPPDAVAASAVCKKLGVPKRIVTILEGESLVNDATGLVAYRFAVAAVLTGVFSLFDASLKFIYVAAGGIIAGLVIGHLAFIVRKKANRNPALAMTLSLLTPFAAYIPAEHLGVSGVLATVVCGIYLTRKSSEVLTSETRLKAIAVWETTVFMMNGIIFILIGLQLPSILKSIGHIPWQELLTISLYISLTTIVIRVVWVIIFTYLPRILSKKLKEKDPSPPFSHILIVGWTGMRGIVSLAAAMALPLTVYHGEPFPHRDLLIFLTFTVISATLILQGLSLPYLIKILKVKKTTYEEVEELNAKIEITESGLQHLNSIIEKNPQFLSCGKLTRVRDEYIDKLELLREEEGEGADEDSILSTSEIKSIQLELLSVENEKLVQLRDKELINDESLRKLLIDIDLARSKIKN